MRQAWSDILSSLDAHFPEYSDTGFNVTYEDDGEVFFSNEFFLGHTCGYPYITKLHETHELVCVPEFDIEGAQDGFYRSWFITRADHPATDLGQFRNSKAIINNWDSNSGMNVLRYAVAPLLCGDSFFDEILVSSSHLNSLEMVVEGLADIAAIDAVTYHFAHTQGLFNPSEIKIIGQSEMTRGLPFVASRNKAIDSDRLINALNQCLDSAEPEFREFLKIKRFSRVSHGDYLPIAQLEKTAQELNYPVLK